MRGMLGGLIAGKVGYTASCLFASVLLVISGYAYKIVSLSTQLSGGISLGGGAVTGAMNILVMGLESRTNYQGQPLPRSLVDAMHTGSTGGQATNTLILIHIFAGGQKAVGFSIPRDDWVTFPQPYDGQSAGKIDQAYGLAYAQSLNETVASSMGSDERYLNANQAGQAAEIATVEMLTSQHVDHFAEVNLAGFYALAQAFNGIEACVKSWDGPNGSGMNLTDYNSGFNAVADGYNLKKGGSQYLHLDAGQSLAFVRERDNLPRGDLDRTHRQQAVLDYITWKLRTGGVLSDFGQLNALLGTARQYIITDAHWNLLDFSTQMHTLSGQSLKFYTAPIVGFETIGGQAANQIDVPTIQAVVKAKFTPPAPAARKSAAEPNSAKKARPIPAASTVTVDVYNGGTAAGLATTVSAALASKGYKAGVIANATAQSQTVTTGVQVFYGAGTSANAAKIANYFGATAIALASLAGGHVEVLLGTGSTVVPAALTQFSATPAAVPSAASASSATSISAGNNGAAGGAVTVASNAKYGIPCVY